METCLIGHTHTHTHNLSFLVFIQNTVPEIKQLDRPTSVDASQCRGSPRLLSSAFWLRSTGAFFSLGRAHCDVSRFLLFLPIILKGLYCLSGVCLCVLSVE